MRTVFTAILIIFTAVPGNDLFPVPADFFNPWIRDEKDRMYGYRNVLGREIYKKDSAAIRDSSGLNFRIDKYGKLSFDPLDDNWKIRTFTRSNAPFHMSEADKFYASGLYEEALSIWKAASFILQLKDVREFEKEAADKAVQSISAFRQKHEFFTDLDRRTEPAVIFDDRTGRTHVFGGEIPLHVVLPGAWSYARPKNKFAENYRAVYLRHAEHELTITWEKPQGLDSFGDPLDNFVYLWDYRQSLDERIKRMNNFIRNEIPSGRCRKKNPPSSEERCVIYEAEMRNMKFYQYFLLKNRRGIYMIYKNPDPADAKNVMEFIAANSGI